MLKLTKRKTKYLAAIAVLKNAKLSALTKISHLLEACLAAPSKMKNETIEACFIINMDGTKYSVKTYADIPHGWKSNKKIGFFTSNEHKETIHNVTIGGKNLIDSIKDDQKSIFDVCIVTPDIKNDVTKIAKYLKSSAPTDAYGTITTDGLSIAKKLSNNERLLIKTIAKKNIIQTIIGNTSMTSTQVCDNLYVVYKAISSHLSLNEKMKASIDAVYISTTQSFGSIKLNVKDLNDLKS